MKPLLPLLCATLFLVHGGLRAEEGAATTAEPAEAVEREASPPLPAVDLTPRLLYLMLMAEISGQRGQLANSAELYLDLTRETRDPRLARRATEIALHTRHPRLIAETARLWIEIEPTSPRGHQVLIGSLATQGQPELLGKAVAAFLASAPQQLSNNLMQLNRLLARGGDRRATLARIDQAIAPYLDRAESHYVRALAAAEAGDAEAAHRSARQALNIRPDWEKALLLRAQLAATRSETLTIHEDFLAAHPKASEVRMVHARLLVSEKRYEEARHQFRLLLETGDPARNGDALFAIAVLSLQLNDSRDAEVQLRRLVEIGHAEADKAHYYLGQIAEEDKRWDEALQWFARVGLGEYYLSARLHGANVIARQGHLDAARHHLTETVASNPTERAKLVIGEAQLLRDAKRFTEAHAVLEAALAHQPDQPDLLYEASLIAEKLNRIGEAEARLRRLIELQPDNAQALNALGYTFAERNIRLDEARTLIERAHDLMPNDPFILDSKGWVLFRQGRTQAALDTLTAAFDLRPDPEIAAHLGEVLWVMGRRDEARATWERARKEYPANELLADTIKRFLP